MTILAIKKQAGASLINLMVGMMVGMLVSFAVYSSVSFYQSSKRSAVAGNSALASAITGMHFISSDIQQAGIGFIINNDFSCDSLNAYFNGVKSDGLPLRPFSITDGGAASDQLTVMYGASINSGVPANLLVPMASASSSIIVNGAYGNGTNQLALLSAPGSNEPCTLVDITQANVTGDLLTLVHDSGGSAYNPPSPDTAYSNSVAYPANAVISNLGGFSWVTWRVNNNTLEMVDNMTGAVQALADNIVFLHAEYGVTNGASDGISQWVSATGEWENLDLAHTRRLRAVRLSIVARNVTRERSLNGEGACDTTTQAPVLWPGSPAISLAADPNWQCYRYRVLRLVVPLKNMVVGVSS